MFLCGKMPWAKIPRVQDAPRGRMFALSLIHIFRTCGHPQAKSIPIIAMTANVFAEDVLAARNAGMDAHIAKPIDLTKLYQALKEKMDAVD